MLKSSLVYFHTQNSLNSLIYLGEENILGLGSGADAAGVEYQPSPRKADVIARVILIRYRDETGCSSAFDSLLQYRPSLPRNPGRELSHVGRSGRELLLVFGKSIANWPQWLEAELWSGNKN